VASPQNGTPGDDLVFLWFFDPDDPKTFNGLEGNDTIYGANNDDTLLGDGGSDQIYGGDGNDFIQGGNESDQLYGDAGDDTLDGGNSDDQLGWAVAPVMMSARAGTAMTS
jgi:Ca2+-binding RTX toxin-like protein